MTHWISWDHGQTSSLFDPLEATLTVSRISAGQSPTRLIAISEKEKEEDEKWP